MAGAGLAIAAAAFFRRSGTPEDKYLSASERISQVFPAGFSNYEAMIEATNARLGGGFGLVEPAQWEAIGITENPRWDPSAVLLECNGGFSETDCGDAGLRGASIGLFQIFHPDTAEPIARSMAMGLTSIYDFMIPRNNAQIALRVMGNINERLGDIGDRLAAYNAGWPRILALGSNEPYPNQAYAQKAYSNYLAVGGVLTARKL